MSWRAVRTVLYKEILELSRTAGHLHQLVLPLILYPLMMVGFSFIATTRSQDAGAKIHRRGDRPERMEWLLPACCPRKSGSAASSPPRVWPTMAICATASIKEFQVALTQEGESPESLSAMAQFPKLHIQYDAANEESNTARSA